MQSKKRPYIDRLKQGQTKRWMHQDKSCSNSIRCGSLKIESHMTKNLLTGICTIHENAKIPTSFCNDISFGKNVQ